MSDEKIALLKTMRYGVLKLRTLGYHGQVNGLSGEQSEIVADISDAIHNIPDALEAESFDLLFHTEVMLGGLNSKYKNNPEVPDLLEHYKSTLAGIRKDA